MFKEAVITECGNYRYSLTRRWYTDSRLLLFIMLNPSTADSFEDDPTIRRCIGFARRNNFGGIKVLNLFAYRTPHPSYLKTAGYPVGEHNDAHIRNALQSPDHGGKVVCAWGANARGMSRVAEVLKLLNQAPITPCTLKLLPDGTPAHPLMLPYSCEITPWSTASSK